MVDILLLVPEKMVADIVKRIWRKFVLSMHVNQQIQLNSTLNIDIFDLSVTHNFGLESAFFDSGDSMWTAKVAKVWNPQLCSSV